MQQFVKWDHDNNKILFGPQGISGDGDNWYPIDEGPEIVNPRTQVRQFVFDESSQTVVGSISGDPVLTWEQVRAAQYGILEEQLDMLWHDINNGALDKTGTFYNHIKAVKDGAPKNS
tara:strand:+ start:372 stop:722 length:351 start_codon:yes stop_codon:yes gene_type:complete